MLVDAGDFSADIAPEAEARNRWVLEGLRRMDYAAINIGELEVIPETDRWSELASVSDLPFVSANAVIPPGSTVKTSPYVVRDIETTGGRHIRVGLLGLAVPASDSLDIEFANPVEKTRQHVDALANQSDVLVVLGQMSSSNAHELARAVPQIDILIGASNDTHPAGVEMEGNTIIVYPYPQGMGLGDLRLFFNEEGRPARFFYRLVPLPSQLEDHPDWLEFQREAEGDINAAKSP